jgi:hypothetical protein
VKLNSLFRDKAYAFSQAGNPEDDCKFATALLEKTNPDLGVKNIFLCSITDHYDVFLFSDDKKQLFKLKISLSDPDGFLKRESVTLRRNPCPSLPILLDYGTIKIGEEVTYLLTRVPYGENIRSHGRSCLMTNLDLFFKSYWALVKSHNVKPTYKKIINYFTKNLMPQNSLPEDSLQALEEYSDYDLCEKFLLDLRTDILNRFEDIQKQLNKKCHASLSLDSVFYYGGGFYFEELHNVCMGHPYIDFCDLLIEMGSPVENDISLWKKFCESDSYPQDRELYSKVYQMCIRKKLADLLISYIKEVYLYDSFRYEEIFYIADSFSHAYPRFRDIESFEKNKDFIMKTICEPIFGVKA